MPCQQGRIFVDKDGKLLVVLATENVKFKQDFSVFTSRIHTLMCDIFYFLSVFHIIL